MNKLPALIMLLLGIAVLSLSSCATVSGRIADWCWANWEAHDYESHEACKVDLAVKYAEQYRAEKAVELPGGTDDTHPMRNLYYQMQTQQTLYKLQRGY